MRPLRRNSQHYRHRSACAVAAACARRLNPRYWRGAGVGSRIIVSGTNEYGSANLGRGDASVGLRGRMLQPVEPSEFEPSQETTIMAKGQQRSNRETKKPKKDKAKVIVAAPTRKEAGWQPDFGPTKKK